MNLGLRRQFKWNFTIAAVSKPIIGADFLGRHNLLVDIRAKKLIDKTTELSTKGCLLKAAAPTVLTLNKKEPYHELLQKYSDITLPTFDHTYKSNVEHHIVTKGPPVYCRARPLPPHKYEAAKKVFQDMIEQGICRPSKSPWASPLHMVNKKNGEYRPCGDYRKLNFITKPDRYPIPRLRDFTYNLYGKKIFSKIDLRKAYNQIRVREEDIEKTAVITPFGLFEFPKMCFGLRNAGQTFQRHIDNISRDLDFAFPFVDDILVASRDLEEHKKHLDTIFKRLQDNGLRLNVSKCVFGKPRLEFLGYDVSKEGIEPTEERIKTISNYPEPKNVQELRRFLGILNFYKESIPKSAHTQRPLYKYLCTAKKNDRTKIQLKEDEKRAFEECKESIKAAVTLSHPSAQQTLGLMCDASDSCCGGVLQQKVHGKWKPLGFFSKKLNDAQQRYSTYDRELLAIYLAIRHFRRMFEGREIIVYTDHKPLTFALSKQKSETETPLRTRYLHFISQFTSRIEHIAGAENIVADALSRIEVITCPSPLDYHDISINQENDEELAYQRLNNMKLRFEQKRIPHVDKHIWCETSTGKNRPYLPKQHRYEAFMAIHNISHPGIRSTRKMITERFFWPNMNTCINNWTKTCISCQKAKVQRHTISPLDNFENAERLTHIHTDIVGPLPISDGKRYILTIIDRATRWPEAFPLADITAETIANTIYSGWISRFGCPAIITSDQGRQYESTLFKNLMKRMGIEKTRTTAYHPQCNGIIERWHRTLKTALTSRLNDSSWTSELPTVLLGLRAALRTDSNVSAAQALYGQTICLPGEVYDPCSYPHSATQIENAISKAIENIRSKKRNTDKRTTFVHDELHKCSHVFIRNDAHRTPLVPTYDGPYQVIKREQKYFTIQVNKRIANISIDRLKPAFILNEDQTNCETKITRSGRISKPPVRFAPG